MENRNVNDIVQTNISYTYNIMINDKMVSLTYGELKAINTLVGLLDMDNPTIKNND